MLHGTDKGFDGISDDGGPGGIQMDTVGQQTITVAPGDGIQALPEDKAPDFDG